MRCCAERADDGHVDRVAIERAVAGQQVELTRAELRLAILLRHQRHQTGLTDLASAFSMSRSSIHELIRRHRR